MAIVHNDNNDISSVIYKWNSRKINYTQISLLPRRGSEALSISQGLIKPLSRFCLAGVTVKVEIESNYYNMKMIYVGNVHIT